MTAALQALSFAFYGTMKSHLDKALQPSSLSASRMVFERAPQLPARSLWSLWKPHHASPARWRGQTIADVQTIQPFAKTVITEPDYGAAVSVTITLVNASGSATDAEGTLSGTGLNQDWHWYLHPCANTPGLVTAELQQLVFASTPGQVQSGQKVTTTFDLAVSDGTDVTTNTSTSVVATTSGPVLSGSWNLGAPDNGQPTAMLKYLTVTDLLSSGPETATITLLDANGNPTDANGVLSGPGLTKTATGTYSISAASLRRNDRRAASSELRIYEP